MVKIVLISIDSRRAMNSMDTVLYYGEPDLFTLCIVTSNYNYKGGGRRGSDPGIPKLFLQNPVIPDLKLKNPESR